MRSGESGKRNCQSVCRPSSIKIFTNMKALSLVLFLLLLFSFCSYKANLNDTDTIQNSSLSLSFDFVSQTVKLETKFENKSVLKFNFPNGDFKNLKINKVDDPIFGEGSTLTIRDSGLGSLSFTLYKSQPFLFCTPSLKNATDSVLNLSKLVPFSFFLDIDKPASQLKTLGTGGLLTPEENPGSYMFLTTVDPETRNGIVCGWLSDNKGSGVLFSDIEGGLVKINAQIDYGQYRLRPGETEETETLVVGYFDDVRLGQEQYADALAEFHQIELRERSAVYCSWYDEKHGGAGSEASSIELAAFVKDSLKQFGLGVIQIDDQWQAGGSYNGPARGFDRVRKSPLRGAVINGTAQNGVPAGYPNGMETTAEAIKKAGLTAGIWWMPFARNHQDPEYANRQHWFAYRPDGTPYETPWGGTSLDLTHPEVQKHVAELSKKMHGWGYDYFKMDGLWTGTVTEQVYINDGYKNDSIGNCQPLYDPFTTQIEAYRNVLKIIREATNNEVFLSGCCISQNMRSFGPAIGLVDAMRIGPDFNHDGESIRTGAIRASRLYFLNGRVWWNDPDPSMIRQGGVSSADPSAAGIGGINRARLLPSYVAVSGQFFLSSDWIPDLPTERLEIMKRCMASHKGIARPVDAFDKNLPEIWLAVDDQTGIKRQVIGLFNWNEESDSIGANLGWAGLKPDIEYYAFSFWDNQPLKNISKQFLYTIPSESCMVIALRERTNHPVVVSTSQHVTQGMIDLKEENWDGSNLEGVSELIGGDVYEMRVAGLNDGGGWNLKEAKIIDSQLPLTINVLPEKEKGWVRIVFKSETSQSVRWSLGF